MRLHLSPEVKTIRLKVDGVNYSAVAAQSTLTSEAVDTAGYDGVRFIVGFGAITTGAVTSIKAQQSSDNNADTYADLEGTGQAVAATASGKVVITEIATPQERYLKHVVSRGTQDAVVDFLIAELVRPRVGATTDDATILARNLFTGPAEGTA